MHIAFIMDGNGRWAKERGKPRTFGHQRGAAVMKNMVRSCTDLGIEKATFYAFSTENWKRSALEVELLMNLLVQYLKNERNTMMEHNVRLRIVGDITPLGERQKEAIREVTDATKKNTGLRLNLAVNYGGRSEIVFAANQCLQHRIPITEENLSSFLQVSSPDLIVRTGGEHRISNFLLWQAAYSEIMFLDKYWPDFTSADLSECLKKFERIDRRYGGVNDH